MYKRGIVRAGKGITLVISNEDMVDIISIKKSIENFVVLIDGVSETANQEGEILDVLLGTLDSLILGNMLTGKGIAIPGKGAVRAGREYNTMDKKV